MTSRGAEQMKNDTIGVDVSKDHLDAYRLADGASRRFVNDTSGRKAFLKWLAEKPVERVVFEPTGPYHRAFESALGAAGVPFAKVNPRQARRFAEATSPASRRSPASQGGVGPVAHTFARSRRRPPSPLHASPRRSSLQSGHMKGTGKPAKVALTAVMRKLVVLANTHSRLPKSRI